MAEDAPEDNMPRGSEKLTQARREEIISACAKLYETMSYKDITIKDIAKETSFTRSSIYNYFATKEEIFLALLRKEYEQWVSELSALRAEAEPGNAEAFAEGLARTLEQRSRMLKIMTMNIYDMEANSRPEQLAEMKGAFGQTLRAVEACLAAYFPGLEEAQREAFVYAFFPFVYGIHPYAIVSDKQRQAMELAGVPFRYHSIYELARTCILKLLPRV